MEQSLFDVVMDEGGGVMTETGEVVRCSKPGSEETRAGLSVVGEAILPLWSFA